MQPKSISEQLFFSTVRIDTCRDDGASGAGTGFFFTHDVGNVEYLFIVTNKHVVEGMCGGRLSFLKSHDALPTLGDGFRLEIQGWPNSWFGHPDPEIDIAICPFCPLLRRINNHYGVDLFFRSVNRGMIPTPQQAAELDAIEMVTFIGYPSGVWDSKNLLPVARRGTTASPIEVDFENKPKFLIDASVFGGSSGSPVFILNEGAYATKSGGITVGSRFFFVGVVAESFFRTNYNEIIPVQIPTNTQPMAKQPEMIDLGIVYKARAVTETIDAFLESNGITNPDAPLD